MGTVIYSSFVVYFSMTCVYLKFIVIIIYHCIFVMISIIITYHYDLGIKHQFTKIPMRSS